MNSTQIELDHEQSQILDDAGVDAFAVVTRAKHPRDPSRWIIHLAGVEWPTARAADAVLHGRMKAIKLRPPQRASSGQTDGMPADDGRPPGGSG
jgi:hypothetical protein